MCVCRIIRETILQGGTQAVGHQSGEVGVGNLKDWLIMNLKDWLIMHFLGKA